MMGQSAKPFAYEKWVYQGTKTNTKKKKKEEKESKGPSYSVTLLIKHPAATEPFLHLMTEESGLTSAFAQLGGQGVTYRVL